MTTPQHITLTGFSGTGKSTVAELVAARLGWQAVDSDDIIEAEAGENIARIFATKGEAWFRERENNVIRSLRDKDRVVVAVGAGALDEATRHAMFEAGLVICLDASVDTVIGRLRNATTEERPVLAALDPAARVSRLKAHRAAAYSLADATINTDYLTTEEVADEVVRFYNTYGGRAFNRPGRVEALTQLPPWLPPPTDAPGATTFVRTTSAEYPVYVSWGALEHLGEHTQRATKARRAFVISDDAVITRWGEEAVTSLRNAGIETLTHTLMPGDASKSLEEAGRAYDWLASCHAERRDTIVALGGGMVNDFAGFIAATYLRGMPVVQAPTTLLAMVDASIGGKTAINHAGAKNIVGAFYQPRAVVADVATLKTLPKRALVEGMGEVIKHALIRDTSLLELLESRLDDLLKLDPDLTTDVIARNVQIKGAVVSEDERETGGVRELLNYGHTLGHAFEAAGLYESLYHGEAVAVGMNAAAMVGERAGVTPSSLVERQRKLIERAGLPLKPPSGINRDRMRAALALDKKIVAGGQRWVLLEDVARPVVRDDISTSIVDSVLAELLS